MANKQNPLNSSDPKSRGGGFQSEKITPDGGHQKMRVWFETEDIIAVFAGFVAVLVAGGMLVGKLPVNSLTVGILSFSGVGAAIAKISSARKKQGKNN